MINTIKHPTETKQPTESTPSTQATAPVQSIPQKVASAGLKAYEQSQQRVKQQILSAQMKSRLLKDQEKTMLTQSAMAFFGSIVLMVLYVFVGVPLLIRFAGNLSGLSVFPKTDTIPPRVPAYAAPAPGTQEETLNITGFAEPKSSVVVVKNNNEDVKTEADDQGSFSLDIKLDEGKNTIALYSIDTAGNESSLGKPYDVSFDKTPPEVEWETPEDKKTVKNLREKSIQVKGKVNENAKVYLNDRFVSSSNDNVFTAQFELQEGENKLIIKAVDPAGNEGISERIVYFRP
jgi:hypothetical protein